MGDREHDPGKGDQMTFRVGAWIVDPRSGEIHREGETVRLEARTIRLLMYLAEHAGETVSIDELLNQVWPGVIVTPDSVYQAVASLRRQLGDDPKQPTYIATVPRLGYRMVAKVEHAMGAAGPTGRSSATKVEIRATERSNVKAKWLVLAVVLVGIGIVAVWTVLVRGKAQENPQAGTFAEPKQKSVAVLPFVDLTDGMKEEEFADGMTEELIDRLSKSADFRVPAATASFYFKGKQVPLVEIVKTLNVDYVIDGSVRKSATRFRVAVRLVRAENGYVIWSESYDRSVVDKLSVQEEIAKEVAKALGTSIVSSHSR